MTETEKALHDTMRQRERQLGAALGVPDETLWDRLLMQVALRCAVPHHSPPADHMGAMDALGEILSNLIIDDCTAEGELVSAYMEHHAALVAALQVPHGVPVLTWAQALVLTNRNGEALKHCMGDLPAMPLPDPDDEEDPLLLDLFSAIHGALSAVILMGVRDARFAKYEAAVALHQACRQWLAAALINGTAQSARALPDADGAWYLADGRVGVVVDGQLDGVPVSCFRWYEDPDDGIRALQVPAAWAVAGAEVAR